MRQLPLTPEGIANDLLIGAPSPEPEVPQRNIQLEGDVFDHAHFDKESFHRGEDMNVIMHIDPDEISSDPWDAIDDQLDEEMLGISSPESDEEHDIPER